MDADTNSIVINLDTLESTDVLDRRNLIFQEQFDLLVKKIRRKAKENRDKLENQECRENQKHDDEARGVPSCFFIDGTRGSGKSTLMRAVRAELKKCKDGDHGLYPLADVDPTELGKGENFFLYLLGRIYRLLDEYFKKRDLRDDKIGQIREAMDALRKMSGGLQVLMDSDGALKESDNPDFFLEKCVDKCADSTLLRKKLCELLGAVAKIVGKEIFLVTIDDADLNFSKCEDVLEYVRKYMQTPRLIFLFAGDMQLYAHVVRGIQMKSFGKTILKHDESHKAHRNQMVDRLEDQYLMKLFPADSRVKMPTIAETPDIKNRVKIATRWEKEKNTTKLPSLGKSMKDFLQPAFGSLDEKVVESIFVSLSLRSVLFMLRDWYGATEGGNKESGDFDWKVANGIQKVALPALVKNNINYSAINGRDFQALMEPIISYLTKKGSWKNNLDFLPDHENQDDLLLSTYFGALVTSTTKNLPAKLLCLLTLYPQSYRASKRFPDRFTRDAMIPLLTKQENWSLYGAIACASMAPTVPSGSNYVRRYGKGVVRLMQGVQTLDREKGTMRRISFENLIRCIESAIESNEKLTERKMGLALAYSICYIQDVRERGYYLSIYNLILRAAEFLNDAKKKKTSLQLDDSNDDAKKEDELKTWIKEYLKKVIDFSGFSRDSGRIVRFREFEDDVMPENETLLDYGLPGVEDPDDEIVDELYQWINCFADETYTTTPTLYSACWRRFLWRCDEETKNFSLRFTEKENAPQAGNLLKSYMKAFIDALNNTFKSFGEEKKTLADCVREFPLWKALFEADEQTSALFASLNEANVGALRNQGYIDAVADADRNVDEAKESLVEAEKALRNQELLSKRAQDAVASAHEQWQKELSKTLALEKIEESLAHYEETHARQVLDAKKMIDELWRKIENYEVQIAMILAETSNNKPTVNKDVLDLQKKLQQALGALNRARTQETREKHEAIIRELQNQINEMTVPSEGLSMEQRKTLVAHQVSLQIARQRLMDAKSDMEADKRAWEKTKINSPRTQRELHLSQQESTRLKKVWEKKNQEYVKMQNKENELFAEYDKALQTLKAAEQKLKEIKESDGE